MKVDYSGHNCIRSLKDEVKRLTLLVDELSKKKNGGELVKVRSKMNECSEFFYKLDGKYFCGVHEQ